MAINKSKSDDDQEGSGAGGTGEGVQFRIKLETSRDDLLSGNEKNALIERHRLHHEQVVGKQKDALLERKQVKEGKKSLNQYGQGQKHGAEGGRPPHPELKDAAQFHGMDPQVNLDPNKNDAKTQDELQNKLQQKYDLTNRPQNVPQFNPKPIQR